LEVLGVQESDEDYAYKTQEVVCPLNQLMMTSRVRIKKRIFGRRIR